MIRLFAHDPGSSNYGWSVVEADKDAVNGRIKFRVLVNGLCPATLHNLKDRVIRSREIESYREWLLGVQRQWGPFRMLCAERFQTRGIQGPTVECVNQMIGAMEQVLWGTPLKTLSAATWKNAVTRSGVDLKSEYKRACVTPHQLDACLIGLYVAHQGYGVKDFGDTDLPKVWDSLLDQIENTSTERLINRKVKRT